ncbi:MAG: type IV secretory system conjugative DNA transfer family protein [Oscillospiraceae bacterium]|nr:type IV secretory system conjugative DNA transfer family protein [Oscillospiraceae bacterium]
MAKKKWNTNAKAPKKRFTTTDLILFGVIVVIVLGFCILLGGAMDLSVVAGKVDTTKLSKGWQTISKHPLWALKRLTDKNSYVPKMLLLGALSVGLFIAYKFAEAPKRLHRQGEEHGSARWGTPKDAKRLLDKSPPEQHIMTDPETGERLTDEEGNYICYWTDNNVILASELKMSLTPWKLSFDPEKRLNLNLNTIIVGTPGSGKTRYIALPNACQLNSSYVFTDPKGEIKRATAQMFLEAGYKVKTFNLIDMIHSNNYNPFEYVFDESGAVVPEKVMMMTKILFNATKGDGEKDDFWTTKGEQTLQAMTFLVYEQSEYDLPKLKDGTPDYSKRDHSLLNYATIGDKMRDLQYPPKGGKKPDGFFLKQNEGESDEAFQKRLSESFLCPLDKQFMELQKRKPNTLAYKLYKEIRNAPEETGQSFLSTANAKTFPFNFPAVSDLTCCDNIQLDTLGDERTVLYIITSATSATFDFLATMMYSQLFDTLSDRANFKHKGSLPVHVRFIMDEFANLGEIPNFERIITYVRSMNMSLVVILQMLTQLKTKYEKSHETITGACSTMIFLGGAEESTIKSISERLGKETIDIRSRNRTLGGKNRSTSENNSIVGRELMQPNEIATMPSSDCLVMISGLPSFYVTKYDLESHPNYQFLGLANPDRNYNHSDQKTVTLAEYQNQQQEKKQAAKAAAEKHASIEQTEEKEQTEEVQQEIGSAFKFVDLLSILRNPPKLKIEDIYANTTEKEDIFGDPFALPVDFDPNMLYPDVRRKEEKSNASDTPPVKERIDFKPVAIPVSEVINDPDVLLAKKPIIDPADEAAESESSEKVATSSNFENESAASDEADEQNEPLIGMPVQEPLSPEDQKTPVEETLSIERELQETPDSDDEFDTSSFEDNLEF